MAMRHVQVLTTVAIELMPLQPDQGLTSQRAAAMTRDATEDANQ
jgi:hypothetical protein